LSQRKRGREPNILCLLRKGVGQTKKEKECELKSPEKTNRTHTNAGRIKVEKVCPGNQSGTLRDRRLYFRGSSKMQNSSKPCLSSVGEEFELMTECQPGSAMISQPKKER